MRCLVHQRQILIKDNKWCLMIRAASEGSIIWLNVSSVKYICQRANMCIKFILMMFGFVRWHKICGIEKKSFFIHMYKHICYAILLHLSGVLLTIWIFELLFWVNGYVGFLWVCMLYVKIDKAYLHFYIIKHISLYTYHKKRFLLFRFCKLLKAHLLLKAPFCLFFFLIDSHWHSQRIRKKKNLI